MWRLISLVLATLVAVQCGGDGNPAGSSPPPFTQTISGTVGAAATSRHLLAIPRSGTMLVTLSWPGAVDLNLYLAPSSCTALYPKPQCGVLVQSDSTSRSQEGIARGVNSGESLAVFVDNLNVSAASSYTLDIRIDNPRVDDPTR